MCRYKNNNNSKTTFILCDICKTYFGVKETLNKHVSTVHEGNKKFKCDNCDAKFGHKYHLNQHVETVLWTTE